MEMASKGTIPTLAAVLALLIPLCSAASAEPRPAEYLARLDLLRNDKAIGETRFQFTSDAKRWRMESQSRGTRGLASFIGLDEFSYSEGDWHDGQPRPLRFERTVKAIVTKRWSADFDWSSGRVLSKHPDGESALALEPGAIDQTAVGLVIQRGLARGENEWHLRVLDEDEIEDQHFRVEASERLQTALGCIEAVRVDKIRDPASTRYTHTWYARNHGYVPVRAQHGKQDSDRYESRILELVVDGVAVSAGPDC